MRLRTAWLVVAFGLFELVYWRMAQLGDLRQHAAQFLGYFGLAFCLYLVVVWWVRHATARDALANRAALIGIVLASVVFRLTLIGLVPSLSDDAYRYLWDGRVQQAGINPYRYAPQDEALAWLRTKEWQSINHKDIATVYPPLTQFAFRVGVWIVPTVLAQKWSFLVCDLAIIGLLIVILIRNGLSPFLCLLYAWHPLVVIEVAASGHNDPLGVLWLLLGLALWESRRRLAGTVAFAFTFLSKFTSLLLVPFYLRRAPTYLGIFVAVVGLGYLPFLGTPHLIPGGDQYAKAWEFNSSLYGLLQTCLGSALLARGFCGIALGLLGVILALRTSDLTGYTLQMIQAAILLAPVLEPWYLLWLIPLLCLRPSWGWSIFSGLVALSYVMLVRYVAEGVWQLPAWVKWVEYGPLYGWLLIQALRLKGSVTVTP